jgi:hypothetical protein
MCHLVLDRSAWVGWSEVVVGSDASALAFSIETRAESGLNPLKRQNASWLLGCEQTRLVYIRKL